MNKPIVVTLLLAIWCGTVGPVRGEAEKEAAEQSAYLSDITMLLKLKWPRNRVINIVCHGHSVPAGYFKTPVVDTFNAYPHLLHKQLKQRFPYAVINVIVTSIGGEGSVSGTKRFEKDVLSLRPDLITIDYALNDRRAGLAKAKTAWESMIKAAKEKNIKILLLTPTADLTSKQDNPKDPLNQHAAQVKELAASHGVGLVDSLQAFKDYAKDKGKTEDLMSQFNHPNRKGHDLVAEELMKWFPD